MIALPLNEDHTVELAAGELLRLEDVPSSGFEWQLELPEGWSLDHDEWGPSLADDEAEGVADEEIISGGVRVLSFAARPGAGPGTAVLRRLRPWEERPPQATVTVHLRPS